MPVPQRSAAGNPKFQYPNSKQYTVGKEKTYKSPFLALLLVYWDLFGIWNLCIGIKFLGVCGRDWYIPSGTFDRPGEEEAHA